MWPCVTGCVNLWVVWVVGGGGGRGGREGGRGDILFCLILSLFAGQSRLISYLKGSWHEIFDFSFFFMNQCPLGPWVLPWGRFEFFQKFAKIFSNECLSPVSTTPAITENPWQGLIPGVVDTGDKNSFENIFVNFRKNLKRPQGSTHGPRGPWFMKKTWSRKSRVRLPLYCRPSL